MRRSLVLCLVLLVGVAVGRDGEQFINELSELRADFDGGRTTGASPAEFAQAVREAARQTGPVARYQDYAAPPTLSPGSNRFDRPDATQTPPRTRDWAPVDPPQPYAEGFSSPTQPPIPSRPTSPERPKHVLLRESAFELERIAHHLEMASLFAEADEVRSAAGKLRKAAREEVASRTRTDAVGQFQVEPAAPTQWTTVPPAPQDSGFRTETRQAPQPTAAPSGSRD